jgi:hypothetical protein
MTKWSVLIAVLALALGACSDGDGRNEVAGLVPATPSATATATVVPTPVPTATAAATATPTPAPTVTPTATAQPGGAPTAAQLQRALLAVNDLGSDAIRWDAGEVQVRYPAVHVTWGFFLSDDHLTIALFDARNGVPDFLALRFLNDMTVNQLTQVEPTGFGTNGVRYRYSYDDEGDHIYGEVAAWRQGQVVVAIQVEGTEPDVCVCAYAKLQHDKLAATIR